MTQRPNAPQKPAPQPKNKGRGPNKPTYKGRRMSRPSSRGRHGGGG